MVERGWGRRDLMRGLEVFFEGERLKREAKISGMAQD